MTWYEITCIINTTETRSSCSLPPLRVEYIHILASVSLVSPISNHFDEVADKIQHTAEHGGRILMHCNTRARESAALCTACLMTA